VAAHQWIRSHLTFANVVSLAALFVALGGTATAVSYVVSSNSQVGPGTISGHTPPSGKHANIIAGSINGKDIADRSGVDTCKAPLTAKYGPICAGSDGGARDWFDATNYCTQYGLRLPTVGEALALANKFVVAGLNKNAGFWTDDLFGSNGNYRAVVIFDAGAPAFTYGSYPDSDTEKTVCVTDPSA
jgi:hypothetical protein